MTATTLEQYSNKHISIYRSLIKTCTSAEELLLNISLQGKTWSQWDWVLLFENMTYDMLFSRMLSAHNKEKSSETLFLDIITTLKTNNILDNVFTNKQVLCSLISFTSDKTFNNFGSAIAKIKIYGILAVLFKKFPKLWTMNYMYSGSGKKRYHRLCTKHTTKYFNTTDIELATMTIDQKLQHFIQAFYI